MFCGVTTADGICTAWRYISCVSIPARAPPARAEKQTARSAPVRGGGGGGGQERCPAPTEPSRGQQDKRRSKPCSPTSVDVVAAAGEGEGDTKLRAWLRGLHAEIRTAARGGGRARTAPAADWLAGWPSIYCPCSLRFAGVCFPPAVARVDRYVLHALAGPTPRAVGGLSSCRDGAHWALVGDRTPLD